MGILDFVLAPFFLTIVYAIAYRLRNRWYEPGTAMSKYFIWGLHVKIIGAVATALIYWYYYGGGDSIHYFWRTELLRDVFFKNPSVLFKLLFNDPLVYDPETYYFFRSLKASDASSYLVVKLAFLSSFPAMGTYLLNAFIFAIICYVGIWKLYVKSTELFPDVSQKYLAYGVLFIPSVFFWGSGLFKDTVTMGCACLFIVAFHELFMKRRSIVQNLVILVVTAYLIGVIKSYILLAMVPALLIWAAYTFRNRIRFSFIRYLFTPVLLVASVAVGFLILQQLGSVFTKFNLENIEEKAEGMQRWHTVRVEQKGSGSAYSLGHVEFTASGILRKMPAAINVALFRPYPWEAGNPVMVLAAAESLVFLYFFLFYMVLRFPFALKQIGREPFLMYCLIFTIIFAFSVGFTSYNFGALVRYKIPCLPTFGILLAVIYGRHQAKKVGKKASKVKKQLPPADVGNAVEGGEESAVPAV